MYHKKVVVVFYKTTLYNKDKRFGERYAIPVAICDDFGHGKYNAIIPNEENAVLDTNQQKLIFEECNNDEK